MAGHHIANRRSCSLFGGLRCENAGAQIEEIRVHKSGHDHMLDTYLSSPDTTSTEQVGSLELHAASAHEPVNTCSDEPKSRPLNSLPHEGMTRGRAPGRPCNAHGMDATISAHIGGWVKRPREPSRPWNVPDPAGRSFGQRRLATARRDRGGPTRVTNQIKGHEPLVRRRLAATTGRTDTWHGV